MFKDKLVLGGRMNLNVNAKLEMERNGIKTVAHGSPTTYLLKSIIDALQYGQGLSYIRTIALVDISFNERDSTSSLSFSKPASNQIQISASISITANYTITNVRIYSSDGLLYFDILLSSPLPVSAGDVVNLTIFITVNVNITLSDDLAGGTVSENLSRLVAEVLGNLKDPDLNYVPSAKDLKLIDIGMIISAGNVLHGAFSITRTGDYSVSASKSFTTTARTTVTDVLVYIAATYTLPNGEVVNYYIIHVSGLNRSYDANSKLVVTFGFSTM